MYFTTYNTSVLIFNFVPLVMIGLTDIGLDDKKTRGKLGACDEVPSVNFNIFMSCQTTC